MATKADFSAEEWSRLLQAPAMAAMAVIAASPSGPIGFAKELVAVGRMLEETSREAAPNPLVGALVADLKAGTRPTVPAEKPGNSGEMKAMALRACRDVADLLARKTSAEDAEGFKDWLLATARRAAEASKEGSFLGIGGARVSDAENAALAEVAGALGRG